MGGSPLHIKKISSLTPACIEQWYTTFLCDDSQGKLHASLLAHTAFQPDSFTVFDRMHAPAFLASHEQNFDHYLHGMMTRKLEQIQQAGHISYDSSAEIVGACIEQVYQFLQSPRQPAKEILNQEFPWIINRLLAILLFGDPRIHPPTHTEFHTLTFQVMLAFLDHYHREMATLSLKQLLTVAIGSGLVGFDMKSRGTIRGDIVAFKPFRQTPPTMITQTIWDGIQAIIQSGLTIDDWDSFSHEVIDKPCTLLWFVDDLPESFVDVFLILRLLQTNPVLHINVVAKDGYYENDAAIADITAMLQYPVFAPLKMMQDRFCIVPTGPHMATANLRKLDPVLCAYIEHADVLFLKGSGIHELFQGGINKPCYTAYILAREFNESEVGFSEEAGPLLFFKTDPGEYAFWGFKGRAARKQQLPDGKELALCWSTLQDHRRRQSLRETKDIVKEIQALLALHNKAYMNEYSYPWQQELQSLISHL